MGIYAVLFGAFYIYLTTMGRRSYSVSGAPRRKTLSPKPVDVSSCGKKTFYLAGPITAHSRPHWLLRDFQAVSVLPHVRAPYAARGRVGTEAVLDCDGQALCRT